MNKLIVIEGACDGIGKTTQYNLLKEKLINDNIDLCCHHFPSYGCDSALLVEKYLKGDFGHPKELSPYFVDTLYAIDRAITWNFKLKQKFENGSTILLDRYTTSSLIYQSALIEDIDEKKKFIDYVIDYEYKKNGIKEPDLVIFLSAPFELVKKIRDSRQSNEGVENDIHESDIDFMKKVYDNACFVAEYLNWSIINCSDNEQMRDANDINEEIYTLIKKR